MPKGERGGNKKGQSYKLSLREQKFVAIYLECGDPTKACIDAKFKTNAPAAYAKKLLAKPKIQQEVARQWELFQNECIAGAQEIMGFYTMVLRGQVKDQFGLDATLADRLKAADALAKRQIDAQAVAQKGLDNEIKISLCWDRSNTPEEPKLVNDEDVVNNFNNIFRIILAILIFFMVLGIFNYGKKDKVDYDKMYNNNNDEFKGFRRYSYVVAVIGFSIVYAILMYLYFVK